MLQEFIANAVTLYWKDTMNVQIVVVIHAFCVRLQLCHFLFRVTSLQYKNRGCQLYLVGNAAQCNGPTGHETFNLLTWES